MAQQATVNINVNATSANKSVNELVDNINKAGGSTASLRLELKKITQELQGLEPGSKRFQELSNRAGQLRDQIADTSATINAVAGNAVERFAMGLTNTIQIGVAGFQALSAAQVLFGTENEEVNKSIQKMTALLNLSQALQTLGGLDQKIVEIRASFASLIPVQQATAVSTTEAAVALEGEAVAATAAAGATEAAAASTTLLGRAMSALPLVGLIAALGFAVKALVDYASADAEAEKQDEKRKKKLEEVKKAQEEDTKALVKSSSEYTTLIYQLKATNQNSERRAELIKQINTTYGTTLKNLSDENEFQEQLNKSVETYITLQYNRFKLDKNQQFIDAQNEKRFKAEQKLNEVRREAQDLVDDGIRKSYEDALSYRQDLREKEKAALKALDEADKATEKLGIRREQLIAIEDKLTEGGKKYVEQTDKSTKSTNEATDAQSKYNEILSKINEISQQTRNTEQETTKKRIEYIDTYLDAEEEARKERIANAKKIYEEVKVVTEKEITDSVKKQELLKANEKAYTELIKSENDKRIVDTQVNTIKLLKEYSDRYSYLLTQNKSLQQEIQFGEGNTADTLIGLEQRKTQIILKQLDDRLNVSKYKNKLDISDYRGVIQTKLGLQLEYFEQERVIAEQTADAEYKRQYELEKSKNDLTKEFIIQETKDANGLLQVKLTLKDQELSAIAKQDEEYRQKEIERLQKNIKEAKTETEKGEAELALTKYTNNILLADDLKALGEETQKSINTTSENLLEESNVKKQEAIAEYNSKVKDETIKTEDEINDARIKRFDDYLAYISSAFSEASNLISQFAQQQQDRSTQQLDDQISLDRERIESQYASALISREQYDNEIQQLEQKQEQDQLEIDRKNFRTEKALSIAGATIDGARAVLGAFAGTQGGIVVRTLAATLAGVFAATQIGLIARQEFRAATGGIVPGDGSGEIDSVPARLAPGEAVINARSTEAFLPLLSAMNEMGGGKSFVPDLPATNQSQRFAPVFVENQNKEPIRAYVVESDISNAQKRISRIERSTRF
jgi:hypothetical protein